MAVDALDKNVYINCSGHRCRGWNLGNWYALMEYIVNSHTIFLANTLNLKGTAQKYGGTINESYQGAFTLCQRSFEQ